MIQLYYYAEKNNYIVAGTTNKAEVVQGFYVKFGDGGVDIEPIAHLYRCNRTRKIQTKLCRQGNTLSRGFWVKALVNQVPNVSLFFKSQVI